MKNTTKKTNNPDVIALVLSLFDAMEEERVTHDAQMTAWKKRQELEKKLRALVITIRKTHEAEGGAK